MTETSWFNPDIRGAAEGLADVGLARADIEDAAARLKRFAPYLAAVFPDTRATLGILESPLVAIPSMQADMERDCGHAVAGRLWLKLDSELPISGSIKARGGIYEVLKHAEDLAVSAGLIGYDDDYAVLAGPEAADFFSGYSVAVGSTGNLGLSIGVMSAELGFQGRRPHVRRCAAVEEGHAASPRRRGGRARVGLLRGRQAGARTGGGRPDLLLHRR